MQRSLVIASGLAALHVIVAWFLREPGISWGGDDTVYLQLASELRHGSYREIHDVLEPWHARFPPVFPAILAIAGLPFGDSFDALVLVLMLMTAASVLLVFDATRRAFDANTGVAVAAVYALNPSVVADGGLLMAESPFRFFLVWAAWSLVRDRDDGAYARYAIVAVVLAALTRTAGLALIPALAIHWALQRRWRLAITYGVVVAFTVGLWMLWTFVAPDGRERILYTAAFTDVVPTAEGSTLLAFVLGLLTQVAEVPGRMRYYLTELGPFALGYPTIPGTLLDNLVLLGAGVVCGLAGLVMGWRRWRPVVLMLLGYLALLLIWRHAFARLVHPVIPLLHATLLPGAYAVAARLRPRLGVFAMWGLAVVLLIGSARALAAEWILRRECDRSRMADSEGCLTPEYREYLKVARWVRDSTPIEAVFVTGKESAFFHHAGRQTIAQIGAVQQDTSAYIAYLRSRGVTHVVVTPVGELSARHNGQVTGSCRHFTVLRGFPNGSLVLRLLAPGEVQPTPDVCEVLAPFRGVEVWDPVEGVTRIVSVRDLPAKGSK